MLFKDLIIKIINSIIMTKDEYIFFILLKKLEGCACERVNLPAARIPTRREDVQKERINNLQ